ncbi:putative transcriptional regulator [Lachnospiraceae bacterium JC7]|nr:putative transcriptional regulator [Lachnospiraceae bacterium JC7]
MLVKNNLQNTRESKGLTQKEVADALCISKDSLSRYERGIQDPRLDIAIKLSQFYQVTMEQLYEV